MFTDTSSGSPTWWKWYFGDGKMSTDQNPVHQYIAKGKYTVRLLVGKDTIFSYICMLQMIDTTKENSTLNILYANESTTSTIKPGMDLIWDENSTEPQQISPQ